MPSGLRPGSVAVKSLHGTWRCWLDHSTRCVPAARSAPLDVRCQARSVGAVALCSVLERPGAAPGRGVLPFGRHDRAHMSFGRYVCSGSLDLGRGERILGGQTTVSSARRRGRMLTGQKAIMPSSFYIVGLFPNFCDASVKCHVVYESVPYSPSLFS